MILVYSDIITERLKYITDFIFGEQFGMKFKLTTDLVDCDEKNICIINYSNQSIEQDSFRINPVEILFENQIKKKDIECFEKNETICFFKTTESDFHFDIFAASFYLLSRYEEYLPHKKDMYGRFSHTSSLAFKNGFLSQPVINIWIKDFSSKLKEKFPSLMFNTKTYKPIITYDIDIAWSYKNKGLLRNIGGFLKSPSLERIKVLAGLQKDPFDCHEDLINIHYNHQSSVIFFFPMAEKRLDYDKNISPSSQLLQELIKKLSLSFSIGLHPSWQSFNNPSLFDNEKEKLESIVGEEITKSRQHYIKFDLPETYQHLIKAGIKNDYSMGYGTINGFRASVAADFLWYDLSKETTTELRIFPFCFMDANSYYEQHQNAKASLNEILQYKKVCEENSGLFISIFHNHIIGTDKKFKGWNNMHKNFISQVL